MAEAVVLGAGVAGIVSAAALAPLVDRVTLIERDHLPQDPRPRRGVPQGEQLHNLLGRAQNHLEGLMPGFLDRIRATGCGDASVADETHVFEMGSLMPTRALGLRLISCPLPTIDHIARSLVLEQHDNVEVVEDAAAIGLSIGADRSVRGAVIEHGGRRELVEGDIVVDATGAGTWADRWLADAGQRAPETEHAQPDQWYVSTIVARRPVAGEPRFWLVFPTPPNSRGALLSPIGDGRWYLSVNGRSGDPIPRTFSEVIEHVRALEDPAIHEAIADAEPLQVPSRYRRTSVHWRRYDEQADPVVGFLPIGDSIATLNPLFGQGMSLAGWQGELLRDAVADGLDGSPRALTLAYHRLAADSVASVWHLGQIIEGALLGPDLSDAAAVRERCERFSTMIREDSELHRAYVAVWHLLEPAAVLEDAIAHLEPS